MKAPTYYSAKQIAKIFDKDPHTIRDWITHGWCAERAGRVGERQNNNGTTYLARVRLSPFA